MSTPTTETPKTLRAEADKFDRAHADSRDPEYCRLHSAELRARAAELESAFFDPNRCLKCGYLGPRSGVENCANCNHVPARLESAGKGEAEPAAKSAAEEAFDKIAVACGCPEWDYPGQLVRDVRAMKDQVGEALAALREIVDLLDEGALRPVHGCEFFADAARAVLARATGGKS